jgi:hypothetical protein
MDPGPIPIPGSRIEGYRNSSPRRIRLMGLGERGGKVVRKLAQRDLPNVEIVTKAQPVGWQDIAETRAGAAANMIIVVCAEGDERLFQPERGKPDMLVTFVLLQVHQRVPAEHEERIAEARRYSDLFVTTSDADYVSDLVDNLAS